MSTALVLLKPYFEGSMQYLGHVLVLYTRVGLIHGENL